MLAHDAPIDIVTDQTSAHDPLSYLPIGVEFDDWQTYAETKPEEFTGRARASMARHVEAMVGFMDKGAEVFDYGNSIRGEAKTAGYERAFDFPGFVPAYIRPLFCEGRARSGGRRCRAIRATSPAPTRPCSTCSPRTSRCPAGSRWPRSGCTSRACRRASAGSATASATGPGCEFNELVAAGEITAPIVIGRDHLDAGSVASPYRETEAMADGSDAIADWPLLNAMVNVASGATWVSIHHGGGVGIGRSIHAGQVSVADGTPLAAEKLARVLSNDPGMGVIRHVDAGYDRAVEVADERTCASRCANNPGFGASPHRMAAKRQTRCRRRPRRTRARSTRRPGAAPRRRPARSRTGARARTRASDTQA